MKRLKAKDIVFVSLQFLLFLFYFLAPFDHKWRLPVWAHFSALILAIFGLLISIAAVFQLKKSLSPFPSPVKSGELITNGIYKLARHPIYSGLILFFTGFAIYDGSPVKLFCSLLLFVLFWFKSLYEERLLTDKFPEYREYKERTHRFFPW